MLDGADYSQTDIALEPESDTNASIATPESSSNSVVEPNTLETNDDAYTHNSGKATFVALAGGGIMGLVATLLAMLI